jgi:hypothetical protein
MSALNSYIGAIKAIALVIIALGLLWTGHHFGAQGVQADWNKANADRANAEKAAVLARVSENQGLFRQQEITNQNITKAHNDELTRVRADLSRAPRLRIGSALCDGPASTAQTAGTGSGNAADTGSRVLSPEMDRDVKALILEMEQVAATGRACQNFVRSIPN